MNTPANPPDPSEPIEPTVRATTWKPSQPAADPDATGDYPRPPQRPPVVDPEQTAVVMRPTHPAPGPGYDPERTTIVPGGLAPRPAQPTPWQQPYPPYPPHPGAVPPYGWTGPPAPARPSWTTRLRALSQTQRIIAGSAAAAVLVLLFTGLIAPGFLLGSSHRLDLSRAETDIAAILSDPNTGYGLRDVGPVRCNNGNAPTIRDGDTFTCDVTVGTTHRTVTARFTDDRGTFTVSKPQ